MAKVKTISQRSFMRGVQAATGLLSIPKAVVTRISNLLFTKRGSLVNIDGQGLVANGNASRLGPYLSLFQAFGGQFLIFLKVQNVNIGTPGTITITGQNNTGGMLTPGTTYFYQVTALDGNGGETLGTAQASAVLGGGNNSNQLSFNGVAAASAYAIYGGNGAQSTQLLAVIPNVNPFSNPILYVDLNNIQVSNAGGPPLVNTTSSTTLYATTGPNGAQPGLNYSSSLQNSSPAQLPVPPYKFPFGMTVLSNPFLGGLSQIAQSGTYGFDSTDKSAGKWYVGTESICGGVVGGICSFPIMLGFNNSTLLFLGNGYQPQVVTLSAAPNVHPILNPISNNFSGSTAYPDWKASTTYSVGNLIRPTAGNAGNFVFKQNTPSGQQGANGPFLSGTGTSGGAAPTWPQTAGAQVSDNNIVWLNTGIQSSAIPAPRGAAHAIVYAGSLWLANTNPTTTSDNLDGPSCIKMSDSNNFNSWNPINVAFLNKDDGTEITGLTTFTIAETGISPLGTLIVFKEFTTFQITGIFGASNFTIQQAKTDMGCVAPRTIVFIPGFGIIRLTHLGPALFDGVNDRVIGEEIRPYLFANQAGDITDIVPMDWGYAWFSKAAQINNPPMYALAIPRIGDHGALSRILEYDLVLKAWTVIDLTLPIAIINQVRGLDGLPVTFIGDYTNDTNGINRIQANDTFSGNWSFRGAEVFNQGASVRTFYREIVLRGNGSPTNVKFTVNINGTTQVYNANTTLLGGGQFFASADILITGFNAHVDVSGTGPVEILAVDWLITPKSEGAPPIFG